MVVEARQGKHAEHAPIFIVFFRRARKGSRARVRSIYSSRALLVLYVRLARAAFRLKRLLENKVCSAGLPNWLIGCCKILFRLVFDSLSSVCHMLYLFLIPQEVFFSYLSIRHCFLNVPTREYYDYRKLSYFPNNTIEMSSLISNEHERITIIIIITVIKTSVKELYFNLSKLAI